MTELDHPLLSALALLPQLSRRGRRILHATLSEIEPGGNDKTARPDPSSRATPRTSAPSRPPRLAKPPRDKAEARGPTATSAKPRPNADWPPLLADLKAQIASGLLSQTELAVALDVGRTTLRGWLTDRRVPSSAARPCDAAEWTDDNVFHRGAALMTALPGKPGGPPSTCEAPVPELAVVPVLKNNQRIVSHFPSDNACARTRAKAPARRACGPQTSSMRQLLMILLTIIVQPFTGGCQQ